ncbi:insulinase family protein [Sphingomonas ginkgonis]|uniref:Insulinase family protein n=1 Tax=Sphingomonas ginkgonis TaxID=2315330 RepID=A0A429V6N8_9SPHN|nr:pitrilysin family protein [Sphingomonas ginkgonis]RST29575.1 insulinase family protein [Sphingomonas ginkgonis]
MSARLHRLPNGVTLLCDPVHGAQSAAVGAYLAVGSRFEAEGLGGLAHMVEHMLFKGAGQRDAKAIAEAIEDVGGSLNAWTARDQTVFHARVLPADVELAVELIASLLRSPHLDGEELEREKNVVLSELGEIHDTPDDLIGDLLFEAAFGDHPLGRPVIGTEPSIRGFSRADLTHWVSDQFVPGRLMLVATGKVDEQALLRLAERHFGDMAATVVEEPRKARFCGGRKLDRRSFDQAHWQFALAGVPATDPTAPALSLFTQAVGGGMSSRLFQQLREERGLAYSIFAWNQGFADTGLFAIGCATDKGTAGETLALSRDILARAVDELSEAEVRRARAQIEASLLMSLETVQGRADHQARMVELFGRVVPLEESLAELRAVDVAAARAAGRALLDGPSALAAIGGGRLALAA